MSVRDLPNQPSLRHLKNEAKQLHKALMAGDPDAAGRVRAHLPRLDAGHDVGDVTLMEAQHVLAREYGFREWPHLVAAADLDFDGLASLSDADTDQLLRRVDQKDLVVALKLAGRDVKLRMLSGMSERVCQFITEEVMFLGPVPEEEVRGVQERIVHLVRRLGRDGDIGWPPGADSPPSRPPSVPDLEPKLAALIAGRLERLSLNEVRALVRGLSAQAQAHGIQSLDTAAEQTPDGFIREGLRLAADGTEPDLIHDLLRTRTRALLQRLENRLRMGLEACAAMCAGDNPRLVVHKLLAVYSADFGEEIEPRHGTVAQLRRRLNEKPATALDLRGLTEFFGDVATIARRQGCPGVAPILDVVDDRFVRTGLRLVAEQAEPQALVETLEMRMGEDLEDYGGRCAVLAAGIAALQAGLTGADLDAAMDAAVAA